MLSKTAAIIICLFLCFFAFSAPAQDVPKAEKPRQTAPKPGAETKVTIDFRDVDIRVVAKFISELTGKNFVFDKLVHDKVTVFSPTKVTPEEAYRLFETILKIHGYTTVPKEDGVIKILPSMKARTDDVETRQVPPVGDRAKQDRVVTQLIRLEHADATEMRGLLQPLVNKTGIIMAYGSGNMLIVTDYASNIDRLLKIVHAVDVPDEGAQLAIIPLEHASAREVAKELASILSPTPTKGKPAMPGKAPFKIEPDDRTNTLIVMARASDIRRIKELAAELDKPSSRGSDRVHVYFLKNAVAEDLAKTLNELTEKAGSVDPKAPRAPTKLLLQEPVFITAEKATNSLIIRAERQDYLVLKDIIEQLDIQRAQVLVEGIIMEMTVGKANALGMEWRFMDPDGTNVIGGTNLPTGSGPGLINTMAANPWAGPAGMVLGVASGTISWGGVDILNIGALIQALERDNEVNILSTPYLLTMDNEEARVVVGEERPFLKSSMTAATNVISPSVTNTYEYKDLGLTLVITPHITQGEYVKLEIFQELKSYLGEVETGAISSTKRETETIVQVKDGATVIISGLIKEEARNQKTQVPCLGNMPGLGWAFKTRTQGSDRLNLLILIKPTIIRTAEQIEELTRKKRDDIDAANEISGEDEGFPQTGPRILED